MILLHVAILFLVWTVAFLVGAVCERMDTYIKRRENDHDKGQLKLLIQRSDRERRWITIDVETWTVVNLAGENKDGRKV
jgi:hypothetical protein